MQTEIQRMGLEPFIQGKPLKLMFNARFYPIFCPVYSVSRVDEYTLTLCVSIKFPRIWSLFIERQLYFMKTWMLVSLRGID